MKTKFIVSFIALSVLAGCAAPARMESMLAESTAQQRIQETPLRGNVSVKDVTGGNSTNPMWTSEVGTEGFRGALEESLKSSRLYAMNQIGKYVLTADLMKVDQPIIGLDMTVTAQVKYAVYERATGKSVYDKSVEVPYTAKFSDSFYGVKRLQLANEGAIRVNIKTLIDDLFALKIEEIELK